MRSARKTLGTLGQPCASAGCSSPKWRIPEPRFEFIVDTLCEHSTSPRCSACCQTQLLQAPHADLSASSLGSYHLEESWIGECRTSFQRFAFHYPSALPALPDEPFLTWITSISLDRNWKGSEISCSSLPCLSQSPCRRSHLDQSL